MRNRKYHILSRIFKKQIDRLGPSEIIRSNRQLLYPKGVILTSFNSIVKCSYWKLTGVKPTYFQSCNLKSDNNWLNASQLLK